MILGVNHINISVPDLTRAIDFYHGVLGFEKVAQLSWEAGDPMSMAGGLILGVRDTAADACVLRAPNMLIELFQFREGGAREQNPGRPVVDHGYTHLCFAVDDVEAEYARLSAVGMSFISAPVELMPGLKTVYGRDPFGNVIEFEEVAGRTNPIQPAIGG